jgi:hypothetical protein
MAKTQHLSPPSTRSLPGPLRVFLQVNALVTATCLLTELFCRLRHLPETYLNPFYIGFRFYDFDSFQKRFHDLHTLAFFRVDQPSSFSYPAPAAFVYATFFPLGVEASLNTFLAFTIICFFGAAFVFAGALMQRGTPARTSFVYTAAAVALAFPFWFCFQRGNIEIVVWVVLALGLWAFTREHDYAAAFCFGLAASLKLAPIIYLGLFLSRRQYRQAAFGLAVAAISMLLGFEFVGPTIPAAWQGMAAAAADRKHEFLTKFDFNAIGFDHTPLGIVSRIVHNAPAMADIAKWYLIAAALLGLALYVFRILCLSIAAVWLPPASFEYTLMHLYFSIVLLALASFSSPQQSIYPMMILLALLVSPLSEFIFHGVRFGGQIKAVLLLILFAMALLRPIFSSLDAPSKPPAEREDTMKPAHASLLHT